MSNLASQLRTIHHIETAFYVFNFFGPIWQGSACLSGAGLQARDRTEVQTSAAFPSLSDVITAGVRLAFSNLSMTFSTIVLSIRFPDAVMVAVHL